ncbi:hypothetical protein MVEG_10711 [Podila verticillata NRRL 6337]|nr:hypothetical protein MVEG_10711 [Podila verticillata NRRL 6337]
MVLEAASMATLGNINANSDDGLMALRSLTLEMKTPHSPRPVLPGGGAFNDRPPPPPAAMRPLAMSAPLFPGIIEEDDFNQPQHAA